MSYWTHHFTVQRLKKLNLKILKLLNKISDTFKYVFLVIAIAVTTFFAYASASQMLETSEESAAIINTAGRQRMYSQRVASFAAQYALGSQFAKNDLIAAVANFETNTRDLQEKMSHLKNDSFGLSNTPLYPRSLQENVKNYLLTARKIVELPPNDARLKYYLSQLFYQAKDPLLNELDQVVINQQHYAENQLDKIAKIQMILFIFIIIMLIVGAFVIVRPMERNANRLRTLTEIDTLTGAYSRRMFIDRAAEEFFDAQKKGNPYSLLMIDIDHFKKINDVFGHAGGDVALTTLIAHISHLLHTDDFIGRLGGEEFAVVLPETCAEEALTVAERIRVSVDNLVLPYGNRHIKLSISIGVASLSDEISNISTLLKLADNALYVAKADGRNKVTVNKLSLVV